MTFRIVLLSAWFLSVWLPSLTVIGGTINVPADQPTIQAGIDVAGNGDEIIVAPGTYNETINFNGKAIAVRSSGGAAVTTIDAGGVGTVVTCNTGEGPTTILEGFTVTGGNNGSNGAGMYNQGSSPNISYCVFDGNVSSTAAAGMKNVNADPIISNCLFTNNTANTWGGGMMNQSSNPTLINCRFIGNHALGGNGGALVCTNGSNAILTNCIFTGNDAGLDGGAMYISDSSPELLHCTLSGNSAGNPSDDIACVFGAKPKLTNCIVWGGLSFFVDATSDPVVIYSNIGGGFPGIGNIDVFPDFADADLRLSGTSLCIDAGISIMGLSEIDLDENVRPFDAPGIANTGLGFPPMDMGAYEFASLPPLPPGSVAECADLDDDLDVDMNDFLTFSNCFNGALNPPKCP